MRIFGTLDDYLPPSQAPSQLGLNMANYYFLSALLKYGTFDEYHFFLSNTAHIKLFLSAHASLTQSEHLKGRIKVFLRLELPEKIKEYNYTVFHQSDHITYFNGLCALRTKLGASFPVTAFIHSVSYQAYMSKYLEMLTCGPARFDALICSSHCGQQALEKRFTQIAEEITEAELCFQMPVIPLGIDEDAHHPAKNDAREKLGLNKEEVIALCFGRFSEVDKMDLFPLLQAFKGATLKSSHKRLVLAGSVHSQSYLKLVSLWINALNLQNQVSLMTDLNETDKIALFHAADFFVSPTDNPQETFGLTLLEAMWAGLPVIASDYDGYKELITEEVGYKIPTYWHHCKELDALQPLIDERTFHLMASQSLCVDVTKLQKAMKTLFEDRALRENMSNAASNRFDNVFAHKKTISYLEKRWDKLKRNIDDTTKSEIAKEHTGDISLNVFETFSHYATRALKDDDIVQLTRLGRDISAKQSAYPLLPNMGDIIDMKEVNATMHQAKTPVSIGDLHLTDKEQQWKKKYLVLWMLKHELLELVPPDHSA